MLLVVVVVVENINPVRLVVQVAVVQVAVVQVAVPVLVTHRQHLLHKETRVVLETELFLPVVVVAVRVLQVQLHKIRGQRPVVMEQHLRLHQPCTQVEERREGLQVLLRRGRQVVAVMVHYIQIQQVRVQLTQVVVAAVRQLPLVELSRLLVQRGGQELLLFII